ncbi:MAG TPA: hypothetical protein VMV90_14585, partial [Rectinemataceae bacterium]|nr:hypothetical protein [Rectinemataceae bacterium]
GGLAGGAGIDDELYRDTLPLDISTATFYELAAWARSLGLSDSGSAGDLRARLYAYYKVSPPPSAAARKGTVITIERADKASYFKLEGGEGDIIRASGGVVLTLKEEDGTTQRIEAQEITYDRAHNAVTARGHVRFLRKSGTTTETFFGDSLSANLDDWTGVFLDGTLRQAGSGAATGQRGLVMSADTMIRRSKNVLVFDNGIITSSQSADPHYSIRAAKVWILGDNEWAIADAVFSIGNVPVLWLPFFYYPGEEIVFHPVVGYRSREGEFVQTTTYLIGRKPQAEGTTGILKLSQEGQSGPMILKGLFLKRDDSAKAAAAASSDVLKVMADAYSSLGVFTALQGSFPKEGAFSNIAFFMGIGFSRSVFLESNGYYSPYDAAAGYQSVWNGSRFVDLSLPFRYGMDSSASFKSGVFNASYDLPLYSDPYFNYDFLNRSEDMDWTQLFSSSSTSSAASSYPAVLTGFSPKFDLNFSYQPAELQPWVSSISLTRFETSMSWLSKQTTSTTENATLYGVDPQRQFFYPDVVRPYDASLTIQGNLYRYNGGVSGSVASMAPTSAAAPAAGTGAGTGGAPGLALREPWSADSTPAAPGASAAASADAGPAAAAPSASAAASGPAAPSGASGGIGTLGDFRTPARAPDFAAASGANPWAASVDWGVTPSSYLEERYKSDVWGSPADIDFSPLYSLVSYNLNATVGAKAAYRQTLFTAGLGLTWIDQNQFRPYLYDQGDYSSGAAAYRLSDYQYRSQQLGASLRLGSQPFADDWLWAPTTLSYSLDATVYGLQFSALDANNNPVYTRNYLGWNSGSITTNSATLTLGIQPWNATQSLALTATMPPTSESYAALLSLKAGPAALTMQDRAYRPTAGQSFSFDPLTSTLTLGVAPWPVLADTLIYDFAAGQPQSNTSSLGWAGVSVALTEQNTPSYDYIMNSGWYANNDSAFRFTDLAIGVNETLQTDKSLPTVWSLGLNSSLDQNIIQFSNSTFTFGLTLGYKIRNILDMAFSIQSQNTAFWRYYPQLFPQIDDVGGADLWRRNIVQDLADSLSVWDSAALQRGLFKLKTLSFTVLHDLEDWTLSLQVAVSPILSSDMRNYVLDTTVSFLVTWKDLSMVKSNVQYDSQGIPQGNPQTITY